MSRAEVVEAAIARAEAVEPQINAIASPLFETARREAAQPAGGPFAGIPYAVKDLYQTIAGVTTTNGSLAFDLPGEADSDLIGRFRAAGLTLLCTSTTPELAISAATESTRYGTTRNPWDLERTSGGSSGGASALVAAGVLPMAHATDGGGSIRGPASCCGLFGLKPSRGRVPIAPGRTEGWNGCSVTHAVTRSVRDSAALLDATHGPELGSRYVAPAPEGTFLEAAGRPPPRLRIAFHAEAAAGVIADPACLEALDDAARLCASLGHHVEAVAPPIDWDAQGRAFSCAVLSALANAVGSRARTLGVGSITDRLEETNRTLVTLGERLTAVQLMAANDAFQAAALVMAKFQQRYDLILTPTMGRPPVPVGAAGLLQSAEAFNAVTTQFSCFTAIYNQTGQPAMSVPMFWSQDGLPIGVQFAARLGEEALLLSVAAELETARPWFGRRPTIRSRG